CRVALRFFFQAEDGIRDRNVTGVQTCALPISIIASVIIGLLIGLATVLIPNPIFARDIAPVWWNYPVWIFTSVVTGMLVATYVRDEPTVRRDRQGTVGMIGGFVAWFA